MSRARMKRHRGLVAEQRRMTAMRRNNEECRVVDWRAMIGNSQMSEFLRPVNQDARVAHLAFGCHRHRTVFAAAIVIARIEEHAARSERDLVLLIERKVRTQRAAIVRILVPFRHRRTVAWA